MPKIVTAETDHNGGTRAQPDVISQHFQQIEGVEIIARELAVSPHPRWKMQHPQTHHFITRLLLADERELFECNHCHIVDPDVASVKAHLSAHSPKPKGPITDVETIKTVLREVERARRLYGASRYAAPAVEALTQLGVRPASGRAWTAPMVTSLYGAYKDKYPVRGPKVQNARQKAKARPQPHKAPPPVDLGGGDPRMQVLTMLVSAEELLVQARALIRSIPDAVIDEELAEKARKYDQMRGLLG